MTPIQLEPIGHTNTIADSSYQQAKKNSEFAVQTVCDQFNAQLRAAFALSWHDWAQTIIDGRSVDTSNPPKPPKSYVVSYFDDPTTGSDPGLAFPVALVTWPYPAQVGPPVADAPAVPKITPPAATLPEPESIRNVPLGDTMPVGFIVTAPDGAKWQKQSSHTPFGIAYFYAKVG